MVLANDRYREPVLGTPMTAATPHTHRPVVTLGGDFGVVNSDGGAGAHQPRGAWTNRPSRSSSPASAQQMHRPRYPGNRRWRTHPRWSQACRVVFPIPSRFARSITNHSSRPSVDRSTPLSGPPGVRRPSSRLTMFLWNRSAHLGG